MNYIKEMNSFYDWLLYNTLPTGAIALWHALMSINNKAGWVDEFTVANLVLQNLTGLSRQGLDKARNILIQRGLIQYKKGSSNQAGRYKIIRFDSQKVGTVVVTGPKDIDVECNKVGTVVVTVGAQEEAQQGHNSSTLNKLNETKLNYINTSTNTESDPLVIDEEFSELARLYQKAGFEVNGFTSGWLQDVIEKYTFEWVKNAILEAERQGARKKPYLEKILNNWKTWGGMKLSTDKNQPKVVVAAKKTRFHNFKGVAEDYTTDQIEDVVARKRREAKERMQKETL